MSDDNSRRQHFVALVEQTLKVHTKRRPIGSGCVISAWECGCGEIVEHHAAHVANEVVTDELWSELAAVESLREAVETLNYARLQEQGYANTDHPPSARSRSKWADVARAAIREYRDQETPPR